MPEIAAAAPAFPGVVGHGHARLLLSRAIARDRLHHALMISGPAGVGKGALARGLACAALCPEQPGVGCGRCDTCRRVLAGRHPDVRHLESSGKSHRIKIDHVREAITRCQHAPYEARRHLLIIDHADALTPTEDASHALLKTLEEPPAGVHFVLCCRNPSVLVDTIVSRCVHLRLAPLADHEVAEVVATRAGVPDAASRDPARVEVAVRLALGCPGVALDLLDDGDALAPIQAFTAEMIAAADAGPARIFAGDDAPLWRSFGAAWESIADPEADADDDPPPEVVVVRNEGRKVRAPRARKKGAKITEARARQIRPYQQRTATRRMTELWAIHLREQLRGAPGIAGLPATRRAPPSLVRQLDRVRRLRDALDGNLNVRLALEQTLLEMSDGDPTA